MPETSSAVFPLPGNVGSLYTISAAEWAAINQQAAAVVSAQVIAEIVSSVIPNYPALLQVSSLWQTQTRAGLVAQAALVGIFAADVPPTLKQIQQATAGLADTAVLTPNQQFLWRLNFQALADHANTVLQSVTALAPSLSSFVAQSQQADTVLQRLSSQLPPDWQSIAGPLGLLTSGLAVLQGGWSTIAAQLQALSSGQVVFGTAGQVRAAVAEALPAWSALQTSAAGLDQNVAAGT